MFHKKHFMTPQAHYPQNKKSKSEINYHQLTVLALLVAWVVSLLNL